MLYSDDFVVSVVCFESSSYPLINGTSQVESAMYIPASLSEIFVCMCAIEGGKLKTVGASSPRWYRGRYDSFERIHVLDELHDAKACFPVCYTLLQEVSHSFVFVERSST